MCVLLTFYISGALVRLSQNVKTNQHMDKYSSYDNGEKTHTIFIFPTRKLLDPTELHTLLQGHILKQRRIVNAPLQCDRVCCACAPQSIEGRGSGRAAALQIE